MYATPALPPPSVYLCECKHWRRAVPQEVVHAFRTVMADVGAHRGFIISIAGFQEGAFEAVANTNIDLVTFEELQEILRSVAHSDGRAVYALCRPAFPLSGLTGTNAALPVESNPW